MKRSQMVDKISRYLQEVSSCPEYVAGVRAEELMEIIEKSGMLPPTIPGIKATDIAIEFPELFVDHGAYGVQVKNASADRILPVELRRNMVTVNLGQFSITSLKDFPDRNEWEPED